MTTNSIKMFRVFSLIVLAMALLAVPTTHAQQSAVAGKALGYRVRDNIREAAVMNHGNTVFYGALRVTGVSGGKVTKVEFVRPNNNRFDGTSAEDLAIGELVYKNAPKAVAKQPTDAEEGMRTLTHILNMTR